MVDYVIFEPETLFFRCVCPSVQTGLPPSVRCSNNTMSAGINGNITDSSVNPSLIILKRYRKNTWRILLIFFNTHIYYSNVASAVFLQPVSEVLRDDDCPSMIYPSRPSTVDKLQIIWFYVKLLARKKLYELQLKHNQKILLNQTLWV